MKLGLPKKSYFNLPFQEYVYSPEKKAIYTEKMFTDIAPVYNFLLKALSIFQDRKWKRYLINNLPSLHSGHIVDLATGTGKIAFLLAEKYPHASIYGIDITDKMLEIAIKDNKYNNVSFEKKNMGEMMYEKNSISLFTGGYALRNTPDLKKLITDIHCQLMPGGIAAFLDFSKSPYRLMQWISFLCLTIWCNFWSIVLHRNRTIYNYIPQSIRIFPNRKELGQLFTNAGFSIVKRKRFLFGITEVIIVKKV